MHIFNPAVCFPVKLVCATLCRPAVEPCAGTAGLPAGGETLVNGTRALPRESCCLLPTLSRPPPATGEKPVAGAALERPAQQPNSGSGSRSSSSSGGGEEKQQVAPGREQPGRKGLLTAGCCSLETRARLRSSIGARRQQQQGQTWGLVANLGSRESWTLGVGLAPRPSL